MLYKILLRYVIIYIIRGDGPMNKDRKMYNKSKTICIRVNEKDIQKLEYLRIKYDVRDHSKVIRLIIENEFNKR